MTATTANIEIRAAGKSEMPELTRVTGYAFANNEVATDDPVPLLPEQTLCGFDGERMIASAGAFDFKIDNASIRFL